MTDLRDISPEARPAPEGWVLSTHTGHFGGGVGPFYHRKWDGPPGIGFFADAWHANLQGMVHGGMLLTLADNALFDAAFRALGPMRAVTVSLQSDFLGPAEVGKFVEAAGEVTRAGKRMVFVRGMITAEEAPVMSFSGILKRFD